jgi:hypothetical protein
LNDRREQATVDSRYAQAGIVRYGSEADIRRRREKRIFERLTMPTQASCIDSGLRGVLAGQLDVIATVLIVQHATAKKVRIISSGLSLGADPLIVTTRRKLSVIRTASFEPPLALPPCRLRKSTHTKTPFCLESSAHCRCYLQASAKHTESV